MTEIIVKRDISHYNKTLEMNITSRKQFDDELKRRGLCLQEEGDDLARQARERERKPYKIDKDTEKFIAEVRMKAKDGKVRLESRAIDFMKKKGVHFERTDYKGQEGGWD